MSFDQWFGLLWLIGIAFVMAIHYLPDVEPPQ